MEGNRLKSRFKVQTLGNMLVIDQLMVLERVVGAKQPRSYMYFFPGKFKVVSHMLSFHFTLLASVAIMHYLHSAAIMHYLHSADPLNSTSSQASLLLTLPCALLVLSVLCGYC